MLLAIVPSERTENKWYRLVECRDGKVMCTCPAWKFSGQKNCKHLDKLKKKLLS